jgi:RNA polymerase sigma-70 factor (ECF subfamily)
MEHPHEAAYLEAFDTYADALFRHASSRLSDRERARDVTQDTFIRAWDYLAGGNEIRQWKSFLYRVLNNLIIDEYRRKKDVSLDALVEEDPASEALTASGSRHEVEEALDTLLAIDRVRTLLYNLPEPHQSVLVLRYVDDLSPREIAETLEISENAAAVRLHRATLRLRALCRDNHIL